jgi:hypothetical protein
LFRLFLVALVSLGLSLALSGCYATVDPYPVAPRFDRGCYVNGLWYSNCHWNGNGYYRYYNRRYRQWYRQYRPAPRYRHYRTPRYRRYPVPRYRNQAPRYRTAPRYRRSAPRYRPAPRYRQRAPRYRHQAPRYHQKRAPSRRYRRAPSPQPQQRRYRRRAPRSRDHNTSPPARRRR